MNTQVVALRTRSGELVGYSRIPPFHPPPDVLVWGTRVFRCSNVTDDGALVYVEAFAWCLLSTLTPSAEV